MAGAQSGEGAERIGRRLRALRRARAATLAEVAALTGVSISALSKIENAQTSASYDILKRICDGLGIGVEELVSTAPVPTLAGHRTVTRAGDGERFRSDQYDYRVHAGGIARKGMIPLEIVVRARAIDEFDHWSRHRGEEFVFVLAGAIAVHIEHHAPFVLNAGESAYFDSGLPHLYVSAGEEDARVLSIAHDPAARSAEPALDVPTPVTRDLRRRESG